MNLGRLARALVAGLAFCFWAAAPAGALPRPETFTLNNGLDVVVIPDRRAPVVTFMMWYRAGSGDEQPGKSGIAHFLEHLMFKGTQKIAPSEFSKIVARNGGQDNAFTSYDYTAYFERIARDRLELVMSMEADRMRNLQLTDEIVLPERDVIIEERRQRTDNNPGARLNEQMRRTLYPSHHYGVPVIGWLPDMQGLTRADALAWYATWYAPNNAVMVVAGDVDAAQLRPLAEKYFAGLRPTKNLPARPWIAKAAACAAGKVSLVDPKVRQPALSRLYCMPSGATGDARTLRALEVAGEILGGTDTSRLYRTLVEDKKLAVNAGAQADTSGLAGGLFYLSATTADGVAIATLEAGVDETIQRFLKDGPSEAEVARAKSRLIAAATYALDDQEQLANIFGAALAQGETIDSVVDWERQIGLVTREEVIAAARQTLAAPAVTGWLLPGGAKP
ncbi:MAG: M16 family metallopeptidase [Hyphomonadaceae bacterium]